MKRVMIFALITSTIVLAMSVGMYIRFSQTNYAVYTYIDGRMVFFDYKRNMVIPQNSVNQSGAILINSEDKSKNHIVFKEKMGEGKCIWSDSLGNFIAIPLNNRSIIYKGNMFVRSNDLYFLRKINNNHLTPSFVVNEFDHDKLVKK